LDEYANYLWFFYLKTKDEQNQVISRHLIHITNEKKVKVKYIRCDNSGDNHDLKNQILDNHPKLVCQFVFTALDAPQQNGKVERNLLPYMVGYDLC
jgi:hypothetical protein